MSKFSNFKIKWTKFEKKLENGGRLGPLRQNFPPPPKRTAGSASDHGFHHGSYGTKDPALIITKGSDRIQDSFVIVLYKSLRIP